MTIVLSPEIEAALAAQAERRGLTPDQLVNEILKDNLRDANGAGQIAVNGSSIEAEEPEEELAEGTMYDLLKPYIGIVNGSDEALSQNCGERFTEYVVKKHREGKL